MTATVHTRPATEYLTVAQATELYPIGRSKLYDLIAAGHIRSFTVGRRRVVVASSIAAYFESLAGGGASRVDELLALVDEDGRLDVDRIPPDATLDDLAAVQRIVRDRRGDAA